MNITRKFTFLSFYSIPKLLTNVKHSRFGPLNVRSHTKSLCSNNFSGYNPVSRLKLYNNAPSANYERGAVPLATTTRHCSNFADGETRTQAQIINKTAGGLLMVDSFSTAGFRLNNGLMAMGSIALFPRSLLSWHVQKAEDITKESLSLFCMLAPKIDVLVLGIGDNGSKFDLSIMSFLRSKNIAIEILPTEKAVSTFNFLNNEGRAVAGAFIPPLTVRAILEDLFDTLRTKDKLFKPQLDDPYM